MSSTNNTEGLSDNGHSRNQSIYTITNNLQGGLNTDLDLALFDNQVTDMLNMRITGEGINQSAKWQPIKGTDLMFTMPTVTESEAVYYMEIIQENVSVTVDFYADGVLLGTLDFNQAFGSIETDLIAILNGVNFIPNQQGDPKKFDPTSDNAEAVVPQLSIVSTTDLTTFFTFYQTQEARRDAIDGQTGLLKVIGGVQTSDVMFIVSTCCTNTTGGTGQYGVAEYNAVTDVWTYTALLTSKELLLSTQHRCEVRGEDSPYYSIYSTDDFQHPRVFYYQGAFITNGAITAVNADGFYAYGSISNSLSLIQNDSGIQVTYNSLTTGSLGSGSYLIAAQGSTTNGASNEFWSQVCNPIELSETIGSGSALTALGSMPNSVTGKGIVVNVANINTDVYQYVNVAVVQMTDGVVGDSFMITVPATQTDMQVAITDNANNAVNLDSTSLGLTEGSGVDHVLNIVLAKGRCVLSNITYEAFELPDSVLANVTLSTDISYIPSVGNITDTTTLAYGEYLDPANVANSAGYMLNETYLVGIRFHLTSGSWTKVYRGNTVTITANPDLTDAAVPTTEANVFSILIDGLDITDIRDQIQGFSYVIAVPKPEVLATGVLILCDDFTDPTKVVGRFGAVAPPIGCGRDYAVFYSPDLILNNRTIPYQPGDQMIMCDQPNRVVFKDINMGAGFYNDILWADYDGYYGGNQTAPFDIDDTIQLGFKQDGALGGNTVVLSDNPFGVGVNNYKYCGKQGGIAVFCSLGLPPFGSTSPTDWGAYPCQYFRPNVNKYEPTYTYDYISVGHYYQVTNNTPNIINGENLMGGDAFTQKTYLKIGYGDQTAGCYLGTGISFYSQNRFNSQMRAYNGIGHVFPTSNLTASDIDGKLTTFLTETETRECFIIDKSMTKIDTNSSSATQDNYVQKFDPFDADIPTTINAPSRFMYSALKPNGSYTDFYRIFAPLDFGDMPTEGGAIMNSDMLGNDLYFWQQFGMYNQPMDANIVIQNSALEAVLGSGAVFSQKPIKITSFGLKQKWAMVKAPSRSGHDCGYWVDWYNKKLMRFGQDGVLVLSDDKMIRQFLGVALRWVTDDMPCYSNGIHGTYDVFNQELWMTVIGVRDVDEWDILVDYDIGTYIKVAYTTHYESSWTLYKSLFNGNVGNYPPDNPDWWEAVPYTDTDAYSYFTLVYSELLDKFTGFYTPKPRIYLRYFDKVISPDSNDANAGVYVHGNGTICTFYQVDEQFGYIEGVITAPKLTMKYYSALAEESFVASTALFTTEEQESFVTSNEFKEVDKHWYSPIWRDSSVTGNPHGTGSRLFGQYMKVKVQFTVGVTNWLRAIRVKLRVP